MRIRPALVIGTLAVAAGGALAFLPLRAESPPAQGAARSVGAARLPAPVVEILGAVPVQDEGRVKPFSTFAGFRMLPINGKRSQKLESGDKIHATEWALLCILDPEQARAQPVFQIQTYEVLDRMGLDRIEGKKKRDRYAYDQLLPGRKQLMTLARQLHEKEAKDLTVVEGQVRGLATNVMRFEELIAFGEFGLRPLDVSGSKELVALFDGNTSPRLADVLERAPDVAGLVFTDNHQGHDHAQGDVSMADVVHQQVALRLRDLSRSASGIALIPPAADADPNTEWLTPADLLMGAFSGEEVDHAAQYAALRDLEAVIASRDDPVAMEAAALAYSAKVEALATARGEYAHVPLEVTYYKWKLFDSSQGFFGLGFLVLAFSWLLPKSKWIYRVVPVMVVAGVVPLVIGITMRCMIRGRPPVSTLYETILFITAVAVLVGLLAEWINRQRIAMALSSVLGLGGMFLANKYELVEGRDTMPNLVAVLDTNFWLATHVTTITIGYAAGLLASAVGHVWILGQMLGIKKGSPGFYKTISRMTYGMVAFGLVFSVVGTVLGGIWANDSWGRFWGWDPKENGALMICIWMGIQLHGRMGGFLRDYGMALTSVFGGMVVAFSWWGVNLLGVGLHSYGFTSGVMFTLLTFFGVEAAFMLLAGGWWLYRKAPAPALADGGGGPPVPPVPPTGS